MATIVTRVGKGSPLSFAEADANFTNLNTDKLERNGSIPMTGNLNLNSNSITNVVNFTASGTVTGGSFSGNGASLTALNATQLTTGTIPVARINGGTSAQFVRGDGAYSNALLGDLVVGSAGSTGAAGLSIGNVLNLSFAEGSGTSVANVFRQSSSAATIIANGYKYTATANGFASSTGISWAKSAIGIGVIAGGITFYADAAATVANGTDVTPTERMRLDATGLAISQGNSATQALNLYRTGSTAAYMAAGNSNTGLDGTWFGVDTAGNAVINQRAALAMIFSTSATERMRISSAGNVTINAPSSGTTLELTAIATGSSMTATDGTRTFVLAHSGGAIQFGSSSNHDVNILSNNTTRVVVGSAGNVAINAPSSGDHTVTHSVGGSQAIGYRGIPRSTTATTIALADRGKCVAVTAGITVPNSTFAAGDAVSIYNDSASAITITAGITTLRQAGTTNTGNRTLAARGMATVWFNSATEAVISGPGVS